MLPGKPYLAPLLALVLTISQWALVLHEYDLHAHESGVDCQLCLHAHSGKAAIPVGALSLTATEATVWLQTISVPHPCSRSALVRHARAPPRILSLVIT